MDFQGIVLSVVNDILNWAVLWQIRQRINTEVLCKTKFAVLLFK